MKPRHWFHCTQEFHGDTFVAERRPPFNRPPKEPLVPRLCVCPTPAECCAAALMGANGPVYVYRTPKPRRAVKPYGVWDQLVTQERWLIPPVEMALRNVIPADRIRRANEALHVYLAWSRRRGHKGVNVRVRIAHLMILTATLGSEFVGISSATFARRMGEEFRIGDPEEYLLKLAGWGTA